MILFKKHAKSRGIASPLRRYTISSFRFRAEREHVTGSGEFYLNAKARIWGLLFSVRHMRSTGTHETLRARIVAYKIPTSALACYKQGFELGALRGLNWMQGANRGLIWVHGFQMGARGGTRARVKPS